MKIFADLHIHSHYSRATSRSLIPEHLHRWAQLKGLSLVATGDISHPQWLTELKEKLDPAPLAEGLFQLKSDLAATIQAQVPTTCQQPVHFILSGEISSIYKKDGIVRKIHNLVFLPSFTAADKLQTALEKIGNIRSDGRPILGLDARNLLEIILGIDDDAHLVPAHIWTPWFSLLGSQSGFDSVEECFGDLTPHIFALETGLSSDPPMNWRLSMLDRYQLVSNSDAHSPENLAREANIFDIDLSYPALFQALKNKDNQDFCGTVEFFPEEGKYHMDGHRKCRRMMRPAETVKQNGLCPVCGKPATLGVNYRVHQLADRPENTNPKDRKHFVSLVPLPEVLSEVMQVGAASKKVQGLFHTMLRDIGPEFAILMDMPLDKIESCAGSLVAEAIRRMRIGLIHAQPGYDGEYGVIHLFKDDERQTILQQGNLFQTAQDFVPSSPPPIKAAEKGTIYTAAKNKLPPVPTSSERQKEPAGKDLRLDDDQVAAIKHRSSPLIIQAGPGSGKTRTLTHRLADLIRTGFGSPDQILAVTFTNKAAAEMRDRLQSLLGDPIVKQMHIHTFHSFGCEILRRAKDLNGRTHDFIILDPVQNPAFYKQLQNKTGDRITAKTLQRISLIKSLLHSPNTVPKDLAETLSQKFIDVFQVYEQLLIEWNAMDFDDLIGLPVKLIRFDAEMRRQLLQQFQIIAVDEFQDINPAQYELFRILAIAAKDVCIIGDPDQAIYGFRGANREFFSRIQEDFPHARLLRLHQNYRSSHIISEASGQMLSGGEDIIQSKAWKKLPAEVKIQFYQASSDRSEAEYIVQEIEKLVGGTSHFSIDTQRADASTNRWCSFSDFAILIRNRLLAPPLIEALTRSGIPFQMASDNLSSNDETIRVILACLRIWWYGKCARPLLESVLGSFLTQEAKLFDQYLRQMEESFSQQNIDYKALLAETPVQEVELCRRLLTGLYHIPKEDAIADVIDYIWQNLPLGSDDATTILRTRLKQLSVPFRDKVDLFIDALMLQQEVDHLDFRPDHVSLLTLHASKGLEFPIVFIAGCEENLLPLSFFNTTSDIEEERRLLYVGMTRAKERLYLIHAKSRFLHGQRHQQSPSRFLAAISELLVQNTKQVKSVKRGQGQLKLF